MSKRTKKRQLNDYQLGWLECLCREIQMGCKRISDDVDDFIYDVESIEGMKREVRAIAARHGLKLFIQRYKMEIIGKVTLVTRDGKRKNLGDGIHNIPAASYILYKNKEDLERYLQTVAEKHGEDYHREMGRLFGYGEKEIEEGRRAEKKQEGQK